MGKKWVGGGKKIGKKCGLVVQKTWETSAERLMGGPQEGVVPRGEKKSKGKEGHKSNGELATRTNSGYEIRSCDIFPSPREKSLQAEKGLGSRKGWVISHKWQKKNSYKGDAVTRSRKQSYCGVEKKRLVRGGKNF